jgi:hypothetical protein
MRNEIELEMVEWSNMRGLMFRMGAYTLYPYPQSDST